MLAANGYMALPHTPHQKRVTWEIVRCIEIAVAIIELDTLATGTEFNEPVG